MITKFTKKTLKKDIENGGMDWQYLNLVADKLRAVYTLFGWVHMLRGFGDARDMVEELTNKALGSLLRDGVSSRVGSAGIEVSVYYGEAGFVNVDYYFCLD